MDTLKRAIISVMSVRNKTLYLFVIIFFLIDLVLFGLIVRDNKEIGVQSDMVPISIVSPEPEIIVEEIPNYKSILILGYGGEGHDGGTLSDVLILSVVDTKNKNIFLISIPRDLWVSIPIRSDLTKKFKINHAHSIGISDRAYPLKEPKYKGRYGGGELAKDVVAEVLGIPIDYFVSISFDGFSEAIDELGGVEVDVLTAFDDYFYPVKGLENETCGFSAEKIAGFHNKYSGFELEKQFDCRYEHLQFGKGKNSMDGSTALKFVRSRHSTQHGGDFARSQRQQALILGIRKKLLTDLSIDDVEGFFERMAKFVTTDIDLSVVSEFVEMGLSPKEFAVKSINLTEENVLISSRSSDGQYILIPKEGDGNWDAVRSYISSEMGN